MPSFLVIVRSAGAFFPLQIKQLLLRAILHNGCTRVINDLSFDIRVKHDSFLSQVQILAPGHYGISSDAGVNIAVGFWAR